MTEPDHLEADLPETGHLETGHLETGVGDGVAPSTARTGIDGVDAVLDSLATLDEVPLEEHVAVYEAAHERLRRALDTRPDVPMRPGRPF